MLLWQCTPVLPAADRSRRELARGIQQRALCEVHVIRRQDVDTSAAWTGLLLYHIEQAEPTIGQPDAGTTSSAPERDVTPPLLDRLLIAARVACWHYNLLDWVSACGLFSAFGETVKDNNVYNTAALRTLLSEGFEVMLRRADGGHFVHLESVDDDGQLHIIDTWGGKRKLRQTSDYSGVRAARVKTEAPEPGGLEPTSLLAVHAQQNIEGLADAVERTGSVKLVNVVGEVDRLPDSFVIFRQHLTAEEIHRYQYEPGRHFDEKLKPILDHYGDRVDAVEDGTNEMIGPSNWDQNRRIVDFALTTAGLVRERYDGAIKTVMLNPGPGAFPLKWIEDFDPVFEISDRHGELIGLHPYTPAIGSRVWIDEWYPLRFVQADEYARSKGWFPLYVGTEAGAIGGNWEVRDDGVEGPPPERRGGLAAP